MTIRHSVVAWSLALSLALSSAGMATAADLKIKFTDRARISYQGDWAIISYQAYTSKTVGTGKRVGVMTCRPGLSGTYQIIAEFKSTENRGTRARYFVDGKLAREVDQRQGTGKGQSSFQKIPLGSFTLTPASTVELRAQDGRSYSFVSFTFSTASAAPPDPGNGGPAGGGDQAGAGASPGAGDVTFTATENGTMTIEPYLSTYRPAALRVFVDGAEILAWVRQDSTARELCVFRGTPDEGSMIEVKPGDFSPADGLKYEVPLKAGQKVRVVKEGDFEPATRLKVTGPFQRKAANLDDVLDLQ